VPYAKLEADLQEALQIFRLNTSPVESFEALVSLARLAQRQGRAEMSMEFLNQAVALAEEVRIQTTNPELRASVFQPLRPAFDLKIALLAERHRQASNIEPSSSRFALEALRTAEQARARALADFQRLDVATSKISAELLERRAKICRELAARYFRLEAMRQRGRQNEADLQIMRQEMSALRRKLDEVNTRIGSMSLQKNAVDSPLTVEALRRLPTNLAVVQYWIGEDASYAWVATRERLRMLRLSTGTTITRTATEFHTALKGFGTVAPEARQRLAERLGALLIQPIAEEVAGKQSLIFIPDGALHYVPFAALRFEVAGSQKYLVQRHDVATAVTVSGLIRASPAPAPGKLKEMLVVADPVYELGDERLSAGPQKLVMRESSALDPLGFVVRGSTNLQPLPRLKGSAIEARQIVSLLPPESVDLLDGVRASKAALLRSNVERYRYIHIGAHAIANRHAPLLSAIMLSAHDAAGQRIDDKLLAADLLNLKFNADLVVLGACDTALGKQLQGEGVLGLHYAVLARGARAVVASLWAVPDQASSALLSRYYTLVLKDRLTSYTALSQAARDTIDTGLSDPAAWAVYFTVLRTLPRT
jgi:CHAT domain-containing protein